MDDARALAGQQVLGWIMLGDRVGRVPFSLEDLDLLKCLADQGAASLLNLQLLQQVMQGRELKAFQTQVKAQVWPDDAALAASLTQSAQDIIDALRGGNTKPGHPHTQFTSISLQPEGRVRMQFAGDSRALYLIEASTNLVDWELIGVASSTIIGQFQFDDKEAGRFAQRFYRLRDR